MWTNSQILVFTNPEAFDNLTRAALSCYFFETILSPGASCPTGTNGRKRGGSIWRNFSSSCDASTNFHIAGNVSQNMLNASQTLAVQHFLCLLSTKKSMECDKIPAEIIFQLVSGHFYSSWKTQLLGAHDAYRANESSHADACLNHQDHLGQQNMLKLMPEFKCQHVAVELLRKVTIEAKRIPNHLPSDSLIFWRPGWLPTIPSQSTQTNSAGHPPECR